MGLKTQNTRILKHLLAGNSITFWGAVDMFGVMHLPRRIKDLKEAGFPIEDTWVTKGKKRFKEYFLSQSYLADQTDVTSLRMGAS